METTYQIKTMTTDQEIQQCWEVVFLLRPHLDQNSWTWTIAEMKENEKFNLVGILDSDKVVAFAGYRVMTSLHTGHFIYIDDLCTLASYRGKGLASELLHHVHAVALSMKLDAMVLDTDFSNHAAQKVYLKHGFKLAALHLECDLKAGI